MTTPTQTTQPDGGVNKLYFAACSQSRFDLIIVGNIGLAGGR